jgi:hypothetical protein
MGLCDSITPFGRSKAVNETPDLSCSADAQVGREEQSTMVFTQYWDPQETDQAEVETNFDDSITDHSKKDITAQLVSPDYTTGAPAAVKSNVTWEATVQIAAVEPEELTPDGYYKRQVTLIRRGAITKTIAAA